MELKTKIKIKIINKDYEITKKIIHIYRILLINLSKKIKLIYN